MQKIDDLIDSISITKWDLSHIEKTGKINGTLRAEIKRIMLEYKDQLSERTNTNETSDKHETEQLNILGVVRSFSEKDLKSYVIKLRKKHQNIEKELIFLDKHNFKLELEGKRIVYETIRRIISETEDEFDLGFVWDDSLDS